MEPLLEKNRPALRSLFQTHTCPNESHVLRAAEVLKLMGKLGVLPALSSANDVQRYMLQASGQHTNRDVRLTYIQFEKLLKVIAHFCFPLAPEKDKFIHLLLFLRQPCEEHYRVHISLRGSKYKGTGIAFTKPKARPGSSLASTFRRLSTGDPLSSTPERESLEWANEHMRATPGMHMHTWSACTDRTEGKKGKVTLAPILFSDSIPTASESAAEDWIQPL